MTSALRRRRQRRYPGVYRGLVVDATDPLSQHRVQVTIPLVSGTAASWAPTLRSPGGVPRVGDEVLVAFEAGQPDRPYVLGVRSTGSSQTVELSDDNGNSLLLSASGVDISTSGQLRIDASTIRCTSAQGRIDAGMWEFSGVVKSQTLITESVVAASYTPGIGNIQ